jgi:uncharacterized membrane protein YphA (DoxX/SURF4 family)
MVGRHFRLRDWSEQNRDFWWDLLRVYLGIALFIRGVVLLRHVTTLTELLRASNLPAHSTFAYLIAFAHFAGGLLMAFGLFTRLAAAIQLPNLAGAILFVHLKQGLFTPEQTLEFATLVFVLLVLFAFGGAGRWSIDWYFGEHAADPLSGALTGTAAPPRNPEPLARS